MPKFDLNSNLGMLRHFPPNVKKICVNTGNILSLNEVKKKAGQNPTDEVSKRLPIFQSVEVRNRKYFYDAVICHMIYYSRSK